MANKEQVSDASFLKKIDQFLETYLVDKAPALPDNVKSVLAKVTPWVNLILVILGVMGLLAMTALVGLASVFAPLAVFGGAGAVADLARGGVMAIVTLGIGIIELVLRAMAIKDLFAFNARGWRLFMYAQILAVVSTLLSLPGSLGGVLLSIVVLYLIYQIRSSFKA